jgi:hypothetical protein
MTEGKFTLLIIRLQFRLQYHRVCIYSSRVNANDKSCGRPTVKEKRMARKTVLVCDMCGAEVGDAKGAVLRLTYSDARRGAKQADLCDNCAGKLPGISVARRGRKPKSAAA